MKKNAKCRFVLLILLLVCFGNTSTAQTPHVSIYFDGAFQTMAVNCPSAPPTSFTDTLYVVAYNFDVQMSSIEYKIDYPVELLFIGDVINPVYTSTGTSENGIEIGFPTPIDGTEPIVVQRVLFFWICDDCGLKPAAIQLPVQPHPASGMVRAVRWPDGAIVEAIGMTSIICPSLPVESTSWGQIKSLYK